MTGSCRKCRTTVGEVKGAIYIYEVDGNARGREATPFGFPPI